MTPPNQPGNPSGEPPWSGQPQRDGPAQNPRPPPPPGYPAQPGYQQPVPHPVDPSYPYPGYPTPGYGVDPQAPHGRESRDGDSLRPRRTSACSHSSSACSASLDFPSCSLSWSGPSLTRSWSLPAVFPTITAESCA